MLRSKGEDMFYGDRGITQSPSNGVYVFISARSFTSKFTLRHPGEICP